ncbi:hypothetical protein CDAR_90121 [Caerostris darwini]|uniref:Uncharacterized protein n=1 Tax=Caerostris darwini TaxID=1538125 RepID=A0AAV4QH34_9ARAC|nr:hypothetical protein CDAR_90121 [Caerostris darwini]
MPLEKSDWGRVRERRVGKVTIMISLLRKIHYDWISSRVQHTPVPQKLFTILITLACFATRSRTRQMCFLMEGCAKNSKIVITNCAFREECLSIQGSMC